MAAATTTTTGSKTIRMKLLIDRSRRRILFAEAGKECVDFLFHILALPLGTVVGLLTKASTPGSIGSLYGSLESLGTDYFQQGVNKDCLLRPKLASGSASNVPLLTVDPAPVDLGAKPFYTCYKYRGTYGYASHPYFSDGPGAVCRMCKEKMNYPLSYVPPPAPVQRNEECLGYVKELVTYMIMDDLSVQPMSTISSITVLSKFNVYDLRHLEEKDVHLDLNLGVKLLKASLVSKTVLTDIFVGRCMPAYG